MLLWDVRILLCSLLASLSVVSAGLWLALLLLQVVVEDLHQHLVVCFFVVHIVWLTAAQSPTRERLS